MAGANLHCQDATCTSTEDSIILLGQTDANFISEFSKSHSAALASIFYNSYSQEQTIIKPVGNELD